ncbi:MAG: hypothetical protein KDK55_07060 [Chlamydiia bacterium]|nr:hypothetical protein [Chlamydiia bacterium]
MLPIEDSTESSALILFFQSPFTTKQKQKILGWAKFALITALVFTILGGSVGLLSLLGGLTGATAPMRALYIAIGSPWNKIMTISGIASFKVIILIKRRSFSCLGYLKQIFKQKSHEVNLDEI